MNTGDIHSSFLSDFSSPDFRKASHHTSSQDKVTMSQRQSKDVTIMTSEGDKVTLSSNSEFYQLYQNYSNSYKTDQDINSSFSEQSYTEIGKIFEFSVEGDLSDKELEEINKVLDVIDDVMGEFLSGDIDSAVAKVFEIGNMSTISSFEADLQFEQTVMIEQERSFIASNADQMDMAKGIMPESDIITFEVIDKMINRMIQAINDAEIEKSKLIEPIDQLMSHILDQIAAVETEESPSFKAANFMYNSLVQSLYEISTDSEKSIDAA